MRKIKIEGMGVYIPSRKITPSMLAHKIGITEEVLVNKTDVKSRYYAEGEETASYMGAKAAQEALKKANIALEEIDLLISGSGTMQMPIPCNAALIHHALGITKPIPAFDINSTCLSFVTALDTIAHLANSGKYKNILLVSTEVASVGLNYNDLESAALFGDGAAAAVISIKEPSDSCGVIASHMQTFSEGWSHCMIPGGGSGYPPSIWELGNRQMFQFHMKGKEVFKLALKNLPEFVKKLLDDAECSMEDIDLVIPHQASASSLQIFQKRLGLKKDQMINIVNDFGNMIAASIPTAMHYAIEKGLLKRGQRVMLLGTSAGLSIGGLILDY